MLTAIYYDRFGWHDRGEYEAFVHHYGFDLMNWSGYPVLADVRELMMVLWMGQQVTMSSRAVEEFVRRVHALRAGGNRQRLAAVLGGVCQYGSRLVGLACS